MNGLDSSASLGMTIWGARRITLALLRLHKVMNKGCGCGVTHAPSQEMPIRHGMVAEAEGGFDVTAAFPGPRAPGSLSY